MKKLTLALLAACCCIAFSSPLLAQEGSLDPAFGTGGKVLDVITPQVISDGSPAQSRPVTLVQSTGNILQINHVPSGGVFVTRFLPNGAVDAAFGTGGTITFPAQGWLTRLWDAYMLPDDRIYIAGQASGSVSAFGVMRLNDDGTPDNSFDGDGIASLSVGGTGSLPKVGMNLQADGKILLASTVNGNVFVGRLLPDGSADASFNGTGMVLQNFPNQWKGGLDVVAHNDGRIFVSGYASNTAPGTFGPPEVQQDAAVFGFNSDGSLNTSFGNGGIYSFVVAQNTEEATNLDIDPMTNKLIVSGGQYFTSDPTNGSVFFAIRLSYDGVPDGTFGTTGNGRVTMRIPSTSGTAWGNDLKIQVNGKILVSGTYLCQSSFCRPGLADIVVWRLNNNGAVDNTFTPSGYVMLFMDAGTGPSFATTTIEIGGSLASQGNKLIVGGLSRNQGSAPVTKNFLVRLNTTSPIISPFIPPANYVTIPAKIEAENYTAMSGVQKEPTLDAGGGENIGYQDDGDWMDYGVNVPAAGTYTLKFRVATIQIDAQFQLRSSTGTVLATVTVPSTGNWQGWTTVTATATLPAGAQTLRIFTSRANGGWNINWWEITNDTTTTPPPPPSSHFNQYPY